MNKMNYSQDVIDRFWSKVKIPDDLTQCWEWQAFSNDRGYGKSHINGQMMYVHRFSYEYYNGQIPDGLFVLHECDNPPCVNPSHLFLGTQQDNMTDMVNKNRSCKGSKNNNKLTENQVREILIDIYNYKYSNVGDICLKYSIGETTIKSILYGKTWTHITDQLQVKLSDIAKIVLSNFNISGEKNPRCKLTENDVKIIKYELLPKHTCKYISILYNVSLSTINHIKNNRTWNNI